MARLSCLARLQSRLVSDSRAWSRVKVRAAADGLTPSVWVADQVWRLGVAGTFPERVAAIDLNQFTQSI